MFCIVTSSEEGGREGGRVKELETELFMVDFHRDRAPGFHLF